ncbi:MAG: metallophosphoesterase family protein [Pedobacter sp.]|nr:MAG: metallophosphoesterase family protein [Pedobacter sp.]
MFKRLTVFLVAISTLVWPGTALAQNSAYTIIANPGENASSEIRLNWHTDLGSGDSYVIYTTKSDKNWKNTIKAEANQELCTVFDSIYSKKPNGDNFYENVRFLRNTVSLLGLKEDTEYKYKLSNENTNTHYFRTAPKSVKWNMGIISDMHVYAPIPNRQKVAMAMIQQLEKQNKKPFNMMLHVGDMSAWGGSYSFWPTLYADSTFRKYVWAGVNGNHDNMTRLNGQSNQFFRNVNNNPINGYDGEIGVSYHYIYGDALFVMLNNEAMKSVEELAKAQSWTKQVIKNNPAKYVIVMSHYQWFMGDDGRSSQYSRWKALFDECGVDLAISGNNHIYVRTNALYADQETDGSKGTVYLQTPSSDNERGRPVGEQLHNKDIIKSRWSEGSKTVGALIMNANKKRLILTLYNREGKAIDQVLVKSKSKK